MEKEPFFDEICTKLSIDSAVRKNAYLQFTEVCRNTILDVSLINWRIYLLSHLNNYQKSGKMAILKCIGYKIILLLSYLCLFFFFQKGDMRHWICCALFTACTKQKIPTVVLSDTFVQGNGVSLAKLIKECNLR